MGAGNKLTGASTKIADAWNNFRGKTGSTILESTAIRIDKFKERKVRRLTRQDIWLSRAVAKITTDLREEKKG